jgi:hypothetical protein
MAGFSINLGDRIEYQSTSFLAMKYGRMERIREATGIEPHPEYMDREEGFS